MKQLILFVRMGFGRCSIPVILAVMLSVPATAFAFDFEFGPLSGNVSSSLTLGAMWRMEDQDPSNISKGNNNPGFCVQNNNDGTFSGDTCFSSSDPGPNRRYLGIEGSFTPNGDNGNMNYDKNELVSAVAKLRSDLTFNVWNLDFFIRGIYFYDAENSDREDRHSDTTFQPARTARSDIEEDLLGSKFDILDAYVSTYLPFFGDRELSVKLGDQVINWGESTFLLLNSINSINPPSAARLRIPGFDVSELFVPAGMISVATDITPTIGFEAFYQYEWEPAVPDPRGSFFSTADSITPGSDYVMLGFGKNPEDPQGIYSSEQNPDDVSGLVTDSSRTLFRIQDNLPEDGGQYGAKFSYFAENLNGGTEFALYYTNTHSRFPIASFLATDQSCAGPNAASPLDVVAGCGLTPAAIPGVAGLLGVPAAALAPFALLPGADSVGRLGLGGDAFPVDTAQLVAEYPEDIELYGFSFNTTVGDWALSGEVAYRPNQPFQINSTDLVFAALQPAFFGSPVAVPGVGVLPGRREGIPDYVQTLFRNDPVEPNSYIQGYESLKSINAGFTLLNTLGGGHFVSNFLGSDQTIVLFEAGFNKVLDFPGLHELQFNGPADTHFSAGADGSGKDVRDEFGPSSTDCSDACRLNPTVEDSDKYPDDFSWGVRAVSLIRYQDAIFGINLEPLVGVFADIKGIGPGPGNNFSEGDRTYLLGLRGDYLSKWNGELRYSILKGDNNARRDRDNLFLFLGYSF